MNHSAGCTSERHLVPALHLLANEPAYGAVITVAAHMTTPATSNGRLPWTPHGDTVLTPLPTTAITKAATHTEPL